MFTYELIFVKENHILVLPKRNQGELKMKKLTAIILSIFVIFSMNICAFATTDTECTVELSEDKTYLCVSGCQDLSHIAKELDLSKLEHIYLEGCKVRCDDGLLSASKLRVVNLDNCDFVDDKVYFSEKLKELYFYGTFPETLSTLKKCKNLRLVSVIESKMKDLKAFSNMGTIEEVDFGYSDVDSIAGIEVGNTIEYLSFTNVQIESIEELRNLDGLRRLDLDQTAVRDLSPLKDVQLYEISISDSHLIENIEVVMEIETLQGLYGLNCQMYYTPEIMKFIEEKDLYSHYEKGDLELREKVIEKCDEIERQYLTDEERISAVVMYACEMITYDYEVYSDDYLCMKYGNNVLKYAFKGTGCCTTYTGLVAMMLNEMDIDCYCVSGEEHIWNIVELDGKHYYLDATWIDSEYDIEYLDESWWFMVTDEEFTNSHNPDSVPASVRNNPESLNGTFNCKTRFRINDYTDYGYEEETETVENQESATETENLTDKPNKEAATEKEETEAAQEEKTTKEKKDKKTVQKEAPEKENNKTIIIVSVSAVAVLLIMAAVIIIMKKRKIHSNEFQPEN